MIRSIVIRAKAKRKPSESQAAVGARAHMECLFPSSAFYSREVKKLARFRATLTRLIRCAFGFC
jgi:hypothetical protein